MLNPVLVFQIYIVLVSANRLVALRRICLSLMEPDLLLVSAFTLWQDVNLAVSVEVNVLSLLQLQLSGIVMELFKEGFGSFRQ